MNPENSPLLLLGIGGAGVSAVRRMRRVCGTALRAHTCDTDAASGGDDVPFTLLGGDRLAGHGAGGDATAARIAFSDKPTILDPVLDGVRLCVIACSLGGGTANGVTGEILRHLHERGIVTLVFAALPFAIEGPDRQHAARAARSSVESAADACAFLPLDDLVGDVETVTLRDALERANDVFATVLSFLWRILATPGYIRLTTEDLLAALRNAGRVRFATASASGANRAEQALEDLRNHPLVAQKDVSDTTSGILLGILAGDDLKLSEIGLLANGVRTTFDEQAAFRLGTVNDETTFGGRLTAVLLVFAPPFCARGRTAQSKGESALRFVTSGFPTDDPTLHGGENLDVPTYLRRKQTLDK